MNRHGNINALYQKALNNEQITEEEFIEAFTKICPSKGKDFAEYVVANMEKDLLNKKSVIENIAIEFDMQDKLDQNNNSSMKDKIWAIHLLETIAVFVRIVRDY